MNTINIEDLNLILIVDNHFGIYAGEVLAERMGKYLNLSKEDFDILSNKEHEFYLEVYSEVLEKDFVLEDGKIYSFYTGECGDVFYCLSEDLQKFYESNEF